jgi:DNA polymerase I
VPLAEDLVADGAQPGVAMAIVSAGQLGTAVAWPGGSRQVPGVGVVDTVDELTPLGVRWTWWSARQAALPLVQAARRVRACWDLAAVARLAHGVHRDDPAAVWAGAYGLDEPPPPREHLDLLDLDQDDADPVRRDGHLSRVWAADGFARTLDTAQQWAQLAVDVQQRQQSALAAVADPRPGQHRVPLALLTAHAESAAALLAVELGEVGLPVDASAVASLLTPVIGPPPRDEEQARAQRLERDDEVRRRFPAGSGVDLRNPAQVRELIATIGLDIPDTRSWRLEPHAATSPAIAALLAWRKAERLSTTYGWQWLAANVDGGRLRGAWSSAEGAGRMTASAGLHNLPAELRPAVRAEPGHLLVRADLGQVEPRVLAVVARDEGLAAAARADDMYAPVAAQLGCDRPTAKVAVLAAMYGQTTGAAGAALQRMERAYPAALAYLRAAEEQGNAGDEIRTYGGRLLRMKPGWGRFARNAVVQGAAAELFKAWAATVRAGLDANNGRIVLCLHDELLLHVPEASAADAAQLVVDALAATAHWWAAGSEVRFTADVTIGESWAAAH